MIDQYRALLTTVAHKYPLLGQALIHHTNTRGMAMSFKNMPYLIHMYKDLPNLEGADICKAVQTGLSELFICLAIREAGWNAKIVAYVLPTFSIRDRFVTQRINKILINSKGYRSFLKANKDQTNWDLGNNRIKRFGSGSLLFLGSNTGGDFVEFSADTLIIDEYDQCDRDNLAKAYDRLRASSSPKFYRLGNPTLPNVGVCRLFDESDQRLWHFRCGRCGEMQPCDWFVNIVEKGDDNIWIPRDYSAYKNDDQIRSICRKCKKPFTRTDDGSWIALEPSSTRAGYRMSRLDVLNEDLNSLYKEWIDAQGNTARLSAFYTSILGTGFEFSGARLSMEILSKSARGGELDYGGGDEYKDIIVTMGVDVGSLLNFCISIIVDEEGKKDPIRQAVLVGAVKSFDEIKDMIVRYHVDVVVIDAMPETRKAQELRDWAIYRDTMIWLCRFHPTPRVGKAKYGMRMDWKSKVIIVDRTQVMDCTFDDITQDQRVFPRDVFLVLGFAEQMKAPVRVIDQVKSRIVWVEGSKQDHYRLADVYDRIAYDLSEQTGTYISAKAD